MAEATEPAGRLPAGRPALRKFEVRRRVRLCYESEEHSQEWLCHGTHYYSLTTNH